MMNKQRHSLGAVVVVAWVLLFGTACLSAASYHTAKPVPEGASEMGVALELINQTDEDEGSTVMPTPRVMVRRGIGEDMDIGLTAGHFGTAADFNYMFYNEEPMRISINPYLGLSMSRTFGGDSSDEQPLQPAATSGIVDEILSEGDFTLVTVSPTMLFDLVLSENMTLTLGGKPGIINVRDEEFSTTQWILGMSAGFRFDIDTTFFFPEVNLLKVEDMDGVYLSFGLGFGF